MHRVLALLDLSLLLAGLVTAATAGRSRLVGALLMAVGVLWLPLDNGVLEGPVLLAVGDRHGLTLSDFVGVAGVVVGALRVWPPRGRPARWVAVRAAGVVLVLLAGFVTAAWVTDVRVDDHREDRRERPARAATDASVAQRNSLDIRRSASTLPPV